MKQWVSVSKYIYFIVVLLCITGIVVGAYIKNEADKNHRKDSLALFANEKINLLEGQLLNEITHFQVSLDEFIGQDREGIDDVKPLFALVRGLEYLEYKDNGAIKSIGNDASSVYCVEEGSGSKYIISTSFKGVRIIREYHQGKLCAILKSNVMSLWEKSNTNPLFKGYLSEEELEGVVVTDSNTDSLVQKIIEINNERILVFFETNDGNNEDKGLFDVLYWLWPILSLLILGLMFHSHRVVVNSDITTIENQLQKIAKGDYSNLKESAKSDECKGLFKIINPFTNAINAVQLALEDQSMVDRATQLPNKGFFKREIKRLIEGKSESVVCLVKQYSNATEKEYNLDWFVERIKDLSTTVERDFSALSFVARIRSNELAIVVNKIESLPDGSVLTWVKETMAIPDVLLEKNIIVIKSIDIREVDSYSTLMSKLDKTFAS